MLVWNSEHFFCHILSHHTLNHHSLSGEIPSLCSNNKRRWRERSRSRDWELLHTTWRLAASLPIDIQQSRLFHAYIPESTNYSHFITFSNIGQLLTNLALDRFENSKISTRQSIVNKEMLRCKITKTFEDDRKTETRKLKSKKHLTMVMFLC